MFLRTNLCARRKLLFLLMTLCCLTQAMTAKTTKRSTTTTTTNAPKVEDDNENNNEEQLEGGTEEEESSSVTAANSSDETDDDDNDKDNDEEDDNDNDEEQAQQVITTALKNVLPDGWASSSFASTVNSLWNWIGKGLSESFFGDNDTKDTTAATAVTGRTFGKIRRLQMALIPIIFKFGILTAMVAFLVAIGMKSLFLIKVLIFMNAIAILGKFLTLKTSLGQLEHSAPAFNYNGWNPHVRESSWAPTGPAAPIHSSSHPSKEIHLHIHGAGGQPQVAPHGYNYEPAQSWQKRVDPYGAYTPQNVVGQTDVQSDVPINTDPMTLLPTKYSARYLAY